jgi:hypothetical protein
LIPSFGGYQHPKYFFIPRPGAGLGVGLRQLLYFEKALAGVLGCLQELIFACRIYETYVLAGSLLHRLKIG